MSVALIPALWILPATFHLKKLGEGELD